MNILSHFKRFWRFHGLIAGAISVSVLTLGCAVKDPAFFEGTWVVTEAYQPGISAQSESEADEMLGSSLVYRSDGAHLNQQACLSPEYSEKKIDVAEVALSFKIDSDLLGFDDGKVTQVELVCENGAQELGSVLLYQEHSVAYTVFDGTFFRIEKTL
ncbi:hypothetical protein Q4561_15785 [Alteromonas sp. 1_MG-2023]|uniref:hypothetical protein n=1 Tax=Alteromonas sp. 1_MG-2023 TaxID=3062669 RepID=UPI0026E49059|nr:hypothetical protein [Alteromonas sp. 1_MG-2023]MDO6568533.1 hypothetical protein [Alteromonas sp. 1_MG-2023]